MPHRVFSLQDVVEFLHLSVSEVELLVRRNEIPYERHGDRLVFRRQAVEDWASQRLLGLNKKQLNEFHRNSSAKLYDLSESHAIIPDLMRVDYVDADVKAKTKASVLRQMVQLATATGRVVHPEDLLTSLVERERMGSTALSGGIALLHPRHHDPYMFEDSFIALGRTVQPIPFGSPDGTTTDLFFLVCSQDDRIHLHALARLCMLCFQTSMLLELREAESPAEMYECLVRSEKEVILQM